MSQQISRATQVQYVQNSSQLEEVISILRQCASMAFDIEFDRDRYTYGFSLCLLQVATPGYCFILDPLPGLDLQPVFSIFEDPLPEKLVHCPGEDLRLLHSLGCYPRNLVDTELYCKLLNYEQTSLSAMLMTHLGIGIDKKMQKTNWHIRPLTAAHLEYAATDVVHLHDLRDVLHELAKAKGMLPWIEEEFTLLETTIYQLGPKTDFLKPTDKQYLSVGHQYLLNSLLMFRDNIAKDWNKPAHQVIPEAVIRDIAVGRIPMDALRQTAAVHPALRQGKLLAAFKENFRKAKNQAEHSGLSFERSRKDSATVNAEWERKQRDLQKVKTFTPIQQKLAEEYGTYTARHLFSSTYVNSLLRGETKLSQLKPSYKQSLITNTATALGISLDQWI